MATAGIMIALPLLAFFILLFFGAKFSRPFISLVGVLGISLSAIYAIWFFFESFGLKSEKQPLWVMFSGSFFDVPAIQHGFYIDSLSLTMCLVVTFVSMCIALYSAEYMMDEQGLCRFFALINLFVAFMLLLVLADNLLLLFVGWEGVGLCSYLLIGFYYREKQAELAAMKAFITTRIGDVFLIFALFLCFFVFNTLDIQKIGSLAHSLYPNGGTLITVAAFCFLAGAVGKSAQLPLQTWLPDAMWGPTPVSALIHAATMVTAGVYLVARMSPLFMISEEARLFVLIVGLATLVLAGLLATIQTDMKRVLAYSTMSQIGYMFAALGASAYQAAIFHLATHAFFKALLFLTAGVIGHALHSYDLSQMGGLRRQMPGVFTLFLIGCLSLIGLPLVSAGFFSKEWIFGDVALLHEGSWAFIILVFGSFLTGLYTVRMLVLAFFLDMKSKVVVHYGLRIVIPLTVLAFFSTTMGWLETPSLFGGVHVMQSFLSTSLPSLVSDTSHESLLILFIPTILSLCGVALAILLYGYLKYSAKENPVTAFLKVGGGFDWLYSRLIVRPYVALSEILKGDIVESISKFVVSLIRFLVNLLDRLHTGRLTHYVSFLIVAALALASVMVF